MYDIENLLTDMRCQAEYSDKVTMPIVLYERVKEAVKELKELQERYDALRGNVNNFFDMMEVEHEVDEEIGVWGVDCHIKQVTDSAEYKLMKDAINEANITIESLTAQLDEANKKLLEMSEPDYFYNADNWEVTYHGIDMLEDEMACDGTNIIQVGRLVELPNKFLVCLTNQETDESEYKLFDTIEEAQAKLTKEDI